MTIAQVNNFESIREALNRADPNVLADLLRGNAFGDVLRGLPVTLRAVAPGAHQPQQVSTLQAIELPQDAKAAILHRVTVRAATAAAGEFAIQSYGTTPTTTQAAIAPNGDIVFLTTDAVTSVDVIYTPQKGDVLGNLAYSKLGVTSLTLAVATTGIATIPAPYSGKAILLMQANATVGTVTGQKQILVPATAATAAGTAALSKDGTKVYCNNATDGVTSIVVDLLVASGLVSSAQLPNQGTNATTDLNVILEQANSGAGVSVNTGVYV